MKPTTLAATFEPAITPKPRFLQRMAQRSLRARLQLLKHGVLTLQDGDTSESFGQRSADCALSATVRIHGPAFWSDVAFGGSIGAGEAYIQGLWTVDDLTALVRILLLNRDVLDGMEGGLASITRPIQKVLHWASRNTRDGSRRNIAAHYDLGNDFFRLMLDPTMMYSCALFERPGMTLEEASMAKLERICQRLRLSPADHLVEIGTGWGGLAIHAARNYGCRVTTTTISKEQHDFARARIEAAGLGDRITLLLEDYRDLRGQYDKLVSIEMIEAVGHHYYDEYFAQCSRLLKPEGAMLLQAITIADHRYEAAKHSVDFIQRYIFPGSCIPSVAAITASIARVTDLRLFHLEDIGPHYATTLRLWRENIARNLEQVRAIGYNEAFLRMWEYYLCYCEGGFAEQATGDVHMLFVKPGARWS